MEGKAIENRVYQIVIVCLLIVWVTFGGGGRGSVNSDTYRIFPPQWNYRNCAPFPF